MDKQAIIKALRDTAQSASNSVAETASAPIDAITWALRKAGLPVPENAVGSSDWMAQKGLTAPVEAGIPKMAGEVLGNVIPAIGFAKAPQIARGMNRMVDNAMAPATLGKERGVIDPEMLGLPVNKDGTVSLFHGTTPEGADAIANTRMMKSAGEPNIYFTTAEDAGYGTGGLVKVDVHPRYLNLDDEFPTGRMDFSVDAPKKTFQVKSAVRVK